MNAVHLEKIAMLHLLWVVPVLFAIFMYAAHKRKQALTRVAEAGLLPRINTSVSNAKRWWRAVFVMLAAGAIVFALVRPGWNPTPQEVHRRGRDVVFVVDVSRSMLAEDLAPNRLARAKLAIEDCLDTLRGDRVGLVAFAGTAAVKCPLTLDYGFFRTTLDELHPKAIDRGGTMIGDAVRKALDDLLDAKDNDHKDIILITDGEDHDSFPVQAAEEAGKRGVRIIAIGLGDEHQGKRIPITDDDGSKTFLKHDGQEVWTKLDADTLRKMVAMTPGGNYLNVSTGAFDLGEIYQALVASAEKKDLDAETVERYEEKFQIFLGIGLTALIVATVIPDRKRQTT